MKSITIRDIAQAAGVSPSTAFRALNDQNLVKPATRAKVIAAQQMLENEMSIPKEKTRITKSVGIIVPVSTAHDLSGRPSMFTMIGSFLSELSSNGIGNTMLVFDEKSMSISDLLRETMDGYLVADTSEEQENVIIPALSNAALPCVLVNRRADAPFVSSVNIDDKTACADAADYLISLGHRRIAFLGGRKNYQNTKRRLLGYQQALQNAGLSFNEEYAMFGDYSETSGYTMSDALLRMSPRPTAVICASDPIAIGCMHRLKDASLSLPGDCSIIGFGDIESCRLVSPTLTTIAQPSRELGAIAAKTLIQMMNYSVLINQQLMLQTKLIIRESTAAPLK